MITLDRRQLATVLAALRLLQATGTNALRPTIHAIATDDGTLEPLGLNEIDALCEHLNVANDTEASLTAELAAYRSRHFLSKRGDAEDLLIQLLGNRDQAAVAPHVAWLRDFIVRWDRTVFGYEAT